MRENNSKLNYLTHVKIYKSRFAKKLYKGEDLKGYLMFSKYEVFQNLAVSRINNEV